MMIPDYSQTAEDHASLLVLVQPIGNEVKPALFNEIRQRIFNMKTFELTNPVRKIQLKYKMTYSKEENAWGSFQAHRKVIGLIHIGQCYLQNSKADTFKEAYLQLHKKLKSDYQETLLDSILILLNMNHEVDNNEAPQNDKRNVVVFEAGDPEEDQGNTSHRNGTVALKLNENNQYNQTSSRSQPNNKPVSFCFHAS